jgi:hypothetical protein
MVTRTTVSESRSLDANGFIRTVCIVETTSSLQQRDAPELVDIESWFLRPDLLYKYECEHFDEHDKMHSG